MSCAVPQCLNMSWVRISQKLRDIFQKKKNVIQSESCNVSIMWKTSSLVTIAPYHYGHLNSTYVIKCSLSFTFTLIINDMKRFYRKIIKSKKPSLGSLHGPGPLAPASTSTSTGTTVLMPSIPSFDSDGTASVQVAAGVSVRLASPSHL